jgi:tRNA(Ile)-lysidine synthase
MSTSFDAALASFQPLLPLGVAFSGGADSSALLLACARRWPGQVHALHIHHGLQAAGDAFEAHCRATCQRWQLPLVVRRIDARHAPGQSPEDAARRPGPACR